MQRQAAEAGGDATVPGSVRARVLLGLGRFDDALTAAGQDESPVPDLVKVVARAHLDRGFDAVAAGVEAVRMRLPGAEKAMGDIHAARGELPRALAWYERAATGSRAALRAVARTLAAMGDPAEAAAAHRIALETARFVRVEDLEAYRACCRAVGWTREEHAAESVLAGMAGRAATRGQGG